MTQGEEGAAKPLLRVGGWEVWSYGRPHLRETVSGDLCYAAEAGGALLVVVADVLGHGEAAHRSAVAMLDALQAGVEPQIGYVLASVEEALRCGRGCAMFAGLLRQEEVEYLLVGSIRAWLVGRKEKTILVGQPGIVGQGRVQAKVRRVQAASPVALVVCTDGVRQGFFPQAEVLDAQGVAMPGVLRRVITAYGIAEDDASVLVARRPAENG